MRRILGRRGRCGARGRGAGGVQLRRATPSLRKRRRVTRRATSPATARSSGSRRPARPGADAQRHDADRHAVVGRPGQGQGARPQRVGLLVRARASPRRRTCRRPGRRCSKAGKPVQFMGINYRDASPRPARAFLRASKITYPSLADNGGRTLLALRGKAASTPTTLVLDQQGRLAARVAGQVARATLDGLVDDVLGRGRGDARGSRARPSTAGALPLALARGPGRRARLLRLAVRPAAGAGVPRLRDRTVRRRPASSAAAAGCSLGALLFVLGFTVVFVALRRRFGASAGADRAPGAAHAARRRRRDRPRPGLPRLVPGGQRTWQPRWRPAAGLVGAPLLGAVFGLGWTPVHRPDARRGPRPGRPIAGDGSASRAASCSPRLLPRARPAVPADRRRLLRAPGALGRGCAGTSAAPARRRRPAASVVGLLLVTGVWDDLTAGCRRLVTGSRRRSDEPTDARPEPMDTRPRRAATSRSRGWAPGAAALGLAPADQHAHGAVPAAAARRRRGPRARSGRSAASTPAEVATYLQDHRTPGPWLDRLGVLRRLQLGLVLGDLPAAVRLPGRLRGAARCHPLAGDAAQPPRAPPRLSGCPSSASSRSTRAARGRHREAAREALRGRHYRVAGRRGDGRPLSAERGYLREMGNLVFHLSLVGLLLSVAVGHLWGWRGDVIVPVGRPSPTRPALQHARPRALGRHRGPPAVQPHVDKHDVKFQDQAARCSSGRRASSRPRVTTSAAPGAPDRQADVVG